MPNIDNKYQSLSIYSIIFNLPNSVGYFRFSCMVIALCFAFSQPVTWFVLVQISAWLDVLDGWLARKFNQQSKLGQCFDMVLDRIFDSALCIVICLIYPHYWLLFVSLVIIDLSSHFMLIYKSHLYQQASHKTVNAAPYSLQQYYNNRFVMVVAILFYGYLYGFLYLYHFYPLHWIFILALICLPGALFKVWVNIIQLFYSIKCIAQYDVENPLLD